MRPALITGVTGQDGWYLAEQLLGAGQEVFGLVAAGDPNPVPPGVVPLAGDMCDAASLARALDDSAAGVVFNLAAVSSVAASWQDPVPAGDVTGLGVGRLLAAVHDRADRGIRLVHAGSAEVFGDAPAPQSEATPIAPTNPYGAAKAYAHHLVQVFRAQGVWAATAILFPHESPRRPERFVTRKITAAAAAIAAGRQQELVLGNLAARRDWGFAGDYMRALRLIGAAEEPEDFVVATGQSHSIEQFVAAAFARVGIADWQARVRSSAEFVRPTDAEELRGDASRLRSRLGWEPAVGFEALVAQMVDHDVDLLG